MKTASLEPTLRGDFYLSSTFCVAMLCCHLCHHAQAWQNTDVRFYRAENFQRLGCGHRTRTEALVLHILPGPTQPAFINGIPSVQTRS